MDKKDSQNSQTRWSSGATGVWYLIFFVVLLLGLALLNDGIRMTIITHYPGRYSVGFGGFLGPPTAVIGAYILCVIIPITLAYNLSRKLLGFSILFIIISSVVTASLANRDNAVWQKGIDLKIQETKRKEALEDAKILQAFESNTTVPVKFSLTWSKANDVAPDYYSISLQQRDAAHRKYAIEYIIEPIGNIDMPKFTMGNSSLWYTGEVTRSGYEKLKRNKYTKWLRLGSK